MDYQKLDEILKFISVKDGYCNYLNFLDYYDKKTGIKTPEKFISIDEFFQLANILKKWNLIDDDSNRDDCYIINHNGIDLINSGKSTRDLHEELKRKDKLEDAILRNNYMSSYIPWITLGLSIITLISLFFQYEANNVAERNLKIVEQTYQLELKNKEAIDTIIVRLDNTKKTIK